MALIPVTKGIPTEADDSKSFNTRQKAFLRACFIYEIQHRDTWDFELGVYLKWRGGSIAYTGPRPPQGFLRSLPAGTPRWDPGVVATTPRKRRHSSGDVQPSTPSPPTKRTQTSPSPLTGTTPLHYPPGQGPNKQQIAMNALAMNHAAGLAPMAEVGQGGGLGRQSAPPVAHPEYRQQYLGRVATPQFSTQLPIRTIPSAAPVAEAQNMGYFGLGVGQDQTSLMMQQHTHFPQLQHRRTGGTM